MSRLARAARALVVLALASLALGQFASAGGEGSGNPSTHASPHASHVGFDSEHMAPGAVFNHTFSVIGNYTYHCHPHPYMKGLVIVDWNATETPNGVDVAIVDYKFVPENVTVRPGTTVRFANNDTAGHTVTFLEYDGPMGRQTGGRGLPAPGALAAIGLASALALMAGRRLRRP